MTRAFDSLNQGLSEAISHASSKNQKPIGIKLYQPQSVDASSLPERLSLTQEEFEARIAAAKCRARPNDKG